MPHKTMPDPHDFLRSAGTCITLLRRLDALYPHLPDGRPKYSGMNDAGWNQVDKSKQEFEAARGQTLTSGRVLADQVTNMGGDPLPVLRLVQRVEEVNLQSDAFDAALQNLTAALRTEQPLIEAAFLALRDSYAPQEPFAKTPAYRAGRPKLPERSFRVWKDYEFACSKSGKRSPLDRDLYEWLKVNGRDHCTAKLHDFETWVRYLRNARKLMGKQKHKPASSADAQ